jgi:DNA-binding NarL/FixJ family response regulator
MTRMRIVFVGVIAFFFLSIPEMIEFATGRATFDAAGIAIELSETLSLTATIAAVAWLTFQIFEMRRDRAKLTRELVQSREENVKWRENAAVQMEGVRLAIEAQFDAWQFTPAEKEIASLILKGCSHKQIADLRRSSDTTVRQQAQAIYRKSGLENRSELAAYFLDAILQSSPARQPAPDNAPVPFRRTS